MRAVLLLAGAAVVLALGGCRTNYSLDLRNESDAVLRVRLAEGNRQMVAEADVACPGRFQYRATGADRTRQRQIVAWIPAEPAVEPLEYTLLDGTRVRGSISREDGQLKFDRPFSEPFAYW
jgi:hypothetical protein